MESNLTVNFGDSFSILISLKLSHEIFNSKLRIWCSSM